MKIAVIFGGRSTEHDVSVVSGTSVIKNLNKEKYDILPLYIDKEGILYEYTKDINSIEILKLAEKITDLRKVDDVIKLLKEQDIVFPVLHGVNGEDGKIQGLLDFIGIPYVGCGVLASSVSMDKVYTKVVLEKAGIEQAKSEYIKKCANKYIYIDKEFNEFDYDIDEIIDIIEKSLKYPIFIKPSNSGSSVGITKAKCRAELKNAIIYAGEFDNKIIAEQGIIGKEVECAVLGNDEVIAGDVRRN